MAFRFNPTTANFDWVNPKQNSVENIIQSYPLGETASAMQMVRLDTGFLFKANANTTLANARAFGLLLQGGILNDVVQVLVFGTHADASFSGLPVNGPLFLQNTSFLSDSPLVSGYSVLCGKYLGSDTVFININEPIAL